MATVDTSANVENQENEPVNHEPIQTSTDKGTTSITNDKKEEEPNTTDAKADNEAELLSQGRQLINDKNYNSASDVLSDALEIIQQKNIANTIASVPYYMAYGEALLRLIQSSNDLFAAPAPPPPQEPQEPEAPPLTDETKTNTKEEQEDGVNNEAPTDNAVPNTTVTDTAEDREIAWETLEYARSIIEEYLTREDADKVYIGKLAFVHSMLGELLIEDENNEEALREFESALNLESKIDDFDYRQKAFDRFMACLAAQFCGKDDDALKHCNIALQELSQRIIGLLQGFKCEEESKENEYDALVTITRGVLDKMEDGVSNTENAKELAQLVGSMEDLMAKLEEVKSVIAQKQAMPPQKDGDVNDGGAMDSEDPLARLIKGLTSKFGIDEEELAQLEEMEQKEENKNNKNNYNNNNNNNAEDGVTTIGFGNGATNVDEDDDNEVNELGSFGGNKKTKERKKRSLEEAGIENDDGLQGSVKKIKLNSGDAVPANTEDTK